MVGALKAGYVEEYNDYIAKNPQNPWPIKRDKGQHMCNLIVDAIEFSQFGSLLAHGGLRPTKAPESVLEEVRSLVAILTHAYYPNFEERGDTGEMI